MEFQLRGFLKYILFVVQEQYITAQQFLAILFHVQVTVSHVVIQLTVQIVILILIMQMVLVYNVLAQLILTLPILFVLLVQATVQHA
jgi:hypothetical protein